MSRDALQPKRKPPPSWLLDGFSNLNEKKSHDSSCSKTGSLPIANFPHDYLRGQVDPPLKEKWLSDHILKEIPPNPNDVVVFSASANNASSSSAISKLKQIARQKAYVRRNFSGLERQWWKRKFCFREKTLLGIKPNRR
ncbi:hypothetical protein PIB30_057242 [Stylosanthes scabra]|uniref:Uncharacterized protein n=1 Tax=Stylosanthes scabra TaxID=79078 RepID=A0ABU6SKH9_9FABA|nr:hypothetical protein [Stylosanthes scabra]